MLSGYHLFLVVYTSRSYILASTSVHSLQEEVITTIRSKKCHGEGFWKWLDHHIDKACGRKSLVNRRKGQGWCAPMRSKVRAFRWKVLISFALCVLLVRVRYFFSVSFFFPLSFNIRVLVIITCGLPRFCFFIPGSSFSKGIGASIHFSLGWS